MNENQGAKDHKKTEIDLFCSYIVENRH